MTSTTTPQILLTGATGYIGGSILTQLLNSTTSTLKTSTITCLMRGPERAEKLSSTYGARVRPVLYEGLDDLEATIAVAAQHDIIINTTLGYHPDSSKALVRGLAQRKADTGRDVWLIHTSGCSNLGDRPISGTPAGREFDDAKNDVIGYERELEALFPYAQRTAELGVVDGGLELGVKTLVISSPTIYGIGTGLFNKISIQIPVLIQVVLDQGRAIVLGEGKGVWDHVHIQDLAELYELMVLEIVDKGGKGLPTGNSGYMFSANGRHSWLDIAQHIADACQEEGKITSAQVKSVGLSKGAKMLSPYMGFLTEPGIEIALASNSPTVSSLARSFGWKPTRGEDAWKKGFRDDLKVVLERR